MAKEMTAEELVEMYAPKVPAAAGGIDSLEEMNKRKAERKIKQARMDQMFGPSSSYGRNIKQPSMPAPATSSPASFMAQQEAMANSKRDADMKAQRDAALARIRAVRAAEVKK